MASFCSLPVFTGQGYDHWRLKMKTFFKSQGLWKLVSTGKPSDDDCQKVEQEDAMALYYIQQSLLPTIFSQIVEATSAKSAWDILANKYQLEENMGINPENEPTEHNPYDWAIRKVPEKLRKLNEAAYTPQKVSIGPLHHGKPELADMEKIKSNYLEKFLDRTEKNRSQLTDFIRSCEIHIRRCYSEPCKNLGSLKYVKMILLDSTFIFETLIEAHRKGTCNRILYQPLDIQDLMLFENQLPFGILNKLFTFALPNWNDISFTNLCFKYFGLHIDNCYNDGTDVLHFTDLILRAVVGAIPVDREPTVPTSSRKQLLSTAKELFESRGVRFQPIPYEDGNPSLCNKITFSDRLLKLQELVVDDLTEGLFRNLMVSEQVNRSPNRTWLCSYILLLSFLIKKTPEDVEFLVQRKVTSNHIGTHQDVADMINKLCKNIKFSHFHYSEICGDLGSFIIDIPENKPSKLANELAEEEHKPYDWAIRKVPQKLRELNEAAYTPQKVSIGPLHHGKPKLADMEKIKSNYLEKFLERTEKKWNELTDFIRSCESHIRRCYSEPCWLESIDYVEMILLDSTCIFEMLIELPPYPDMYFPRSDQKELMLFENQLPFDILNKLFSFALPKWDTSFLDLCLQYFGIPNDIYYNDGTDVLHFTDLLLRFVVGAIPADNKEPTVPRSTIKKMLHTAKKLSKLGGVRFQYSAQSGNSLCNKISYNDRLLRLPNLCVNDMTEVLFRNLMVSEQVSRNPNKAWLCSYILLLSFLIKTREDVKILDEEEVISIRFRTHQEVADMINKLCTSIKCSHFHYSEICGDLNRTCQSCYTPFISWLKGCLTMLKDVYFGDLWRGTATVAAVFLLLLTLIQSITSILQVTSSGNKSGNK